MMLTNRLTTLTVGYLPDIMYMNMEDALEYYYKGLSHQENGNFDDALNCFYKSLEIDEHFKTYH
ncbi:MAG: tetratricopeptide repeat protein, partial [Lactobacillus sp.]|nr:tetratricopeptide repeat protein [Lactobacillus sp.]